MLIFCPLKRGLEFDSLAPPGSAPDVSQSRVRALRCSARKRCDLSTPDLDRLPKPRARSVRRVANRERAMVDHLAWAQGYRDRAAKCQLSAKSTSSVKFGECYRLCRPFR
jgi:hypothetical protein